MPPVHKLLGAVSQKHLAWPNIAFPTWNLKDVEGCLKKLITVFFCVCQAKCHIQKVALYHDAWKAANSSPNQGGGIHQKCTLDGASEFKRKLKGVFRFMIRTISWNCMFTLWNFPTRIVFIHKAIQIAGQLLRWKSNFVLGFSLLVCIQLSKGTVLAGCKLRIGFLHWFYLREVLFVWLLVKFYNEFVWQQRFCVGNQWSVSH